MVKAFARRQAPWSGVAVLLSFGCQIVGDIGDRRLADDGFAECRTHAECTERATEEGPDLSDAPEGYTGTLPDGTVPAMCLASKRRCAPLLTPDCPTLIGDPTNDHAILLGTYLTVSGSLANSNVPRMRSALLAAEEINLSIAGGGIPPASGTTERRPLVVLQCDPSADPLRTARHLVDLNVPAVVGPNVAEDIINVTQQISAEGGLLLMSPTAPPDAITNLADNDLTWRVVPADRQRAKLFIHQINEVESRLRTERGKKWLKLAIPFRNDALGLSQRDAISGKLVFNGRFISDSENSSFVTLDPFDLTDTDAQSKLVDKYAEFKPDIMLVVANEVVANIAIPLEKKLRAAGETEGPHYVATDVAKVPTWLAGAENRDVLPDFMYRVRGIGLRPDGNSISVFASFNAAYTSRYGTNPGTSAMGPSYDAMYAIAYALAATTDLPVSGASVAKGLRKLASGPEIPVGLSEANNALQRLADGGAIALRGTHSLLEWDSKGDILGGTLEVWCVRKPGETPVFVSSGVTMDVATQTIDGTNEECTDPE